MEPQLEQPSEIRPRYTQDHPQPEMRNVTVQNLRQSRVVKKPLSSLGRSRTLQIGPRVGRTRQFALADLRIPSVNTQKRPYMIT